MNDFKNRPEDVNPSNWEIAKMAVELNLSTIAVHSIVGNLKESDPDLDEEAINDLIGKMRGYE